MSLLRLTIDFEPDGGTFSRVFSRMKDIADLREPFHDIVDDFKDIERRRFASEGPGWARLSPRYAAWKAAHYPGKSILRRSDRMYHAALNPETHVGPLELRVRINDPKARFHQRGTSRMPRRKLIDLNDADKKRWSKIIHRYSQKVVTRAMAAA